MKEVLRNLIIVVIFGIVALSLQSCGKNEPITQIKEGSHLLVERSGKFIESVGQVPRKIGNKLLGTSEDTDEKADKNEQDIAELLEKLNSAIFELNTDINNLNYDLRSLDDKLVSTINDIHYELLTTSTNNTAQINSLMRKVRRLKQNIRVIDNNIDNLEVVCDYLNLGHRHLLTYCELERN